MRSPALPLAAVLLLFALPAIDSAHAAPAANPEWAPGAVIYEISKGDDKGGLPGLLARLDSLNDGNPHSFGDLGVDVLYIPHAATGEDLGKLRAAAEKRGMKVIVDAGLPKKIDAPLAAALVQGVKEGQAGGIAAQLAELVRRSPTGAGETPYLTRRAYPLDGLGREKSAAAVLLTLPGAPFLEEGDELGTGEKATVAAETGDPDSLLSYHRFLIRARHNSEALRQGSLVLLTPANASTPVLAFLRQTAKETVLVVHNLGDAPVEAGPYDLPGTPDPLYASPGVPPLHGGSGAWKVKLPAHGTGIWQMRIR